MLIGIDASVREGYTGNDHLIDSDDRAAATAAVAGQRFRRSSDALRAARAAYRASCHWRVSGARVQVTLRTARGDSLTVG